MELTPKEVEVLAHFMALEGDLADNPFSTTGRKKVMERMGISPGGLGNYLDKLKKKGFIKQDKNKIITILPVLIPNKAQQVYQFRLVKS